MYINREKHRLFQENQLFTKLIHQFVNSANAGVDSSVAGELRLQNWIKIAVIPSRLPKGNSEVDNNPQIYRSAGQFQMETEGTYSS